MSRVYLDHNATSPLRPYVKEALLSYVGRDVWANPSSVHTSGRAVRALLDTARENVARFIGTSPENIIFTSGGTEANQFAYLPYFKKTVSILSSEVEHPSVLSAHQTLLKQGSHIAYLTLSESTYAQPNLGEHIGKRFELVSFHYANNETGLVFPYEKLLNQMQADLNQTVLHTDAVQALGKLPLRFDESPYHLMSLSGHKVGALQGVGVLVRKKSFAYEPFWPEGAQEKGFRPGTENVLGILSLGAACYDLQKNKQQEVLRIEQLRNNLERALKEKISDVYIIGEKGSRLPNTSCMIFKHTDGESLLMASDLENIEVSMGSACSSGSLEPSHVLLRMGFSKTDALSAIRFSLGWSTTEDDIHRTVNVLPYLVDRIRKLKKK